ncbi:receptor-type tyrosine-protein phosphatase H [Engraulis encrasicolus]|uniref:receptor-type tyrosine-protein phosphatase H n=1 Tax=Engraulis encrasicolus TaxID=184585 RepID=UPI002FD5EDF0
MYKMWTVFLVALVVTVGRAERDYFLMTNASSWVAARQDCQVCYGELATVTPESARHLLEKLQNNSRVAAAWVGLRRIVDGSAVVPSPPNTTRNQSQWFDGTAPWFLPGSRPGDPWFSYVEGRLPWSRWSNGDPVTFHNWYPGRPIPKPVLEPEKCNPDGGLDDPDTTTPTPPMTTASGSTVRSGDTCPQLETLLQCVDDPTARDALSRYVRNQTSTVDPSEAVTAPGINTNPTISADPTTDPTTDSSTPWTLPTRPLCPSDPIEEGLNEFVEDACLVLLGVGWWWERNCSEELPYMCYEERFHGLVNVSGITYTSANLSWLEAPGPISGYRVEVSSDSNSWNETTTSELTTELTNLTAGTQYTVRVFPIKCGRELPPQTASFFTQPGEIRNLRVTDVQNTSVTWSWDRPAEGQVDFYFLCLSGSPCRKINQSAHLDQPINGTIPDLKPGLEYTVEVSAEVADMSKSGPKKEGKFFTKPSFVANLTFNHIHDNTTGFEVKWKPPIEGEASTYRVDITYANGTAVPSPGDKNGLIATSYQQSLLNPGHEFIVTVFAQVNNTVQEGEPVTISAYTVPHPVTNLKLSANAQTITASWEQPDQGGYQEFALTLWEPSVGKVRNETTTTLRHEFPKLKAGAEYTVEVFVIGVGKLISTSTSRPIYTSPNKPRNLEVTNQNKTCVSLQWDVPENSDNVTIRYDVFYEAKFWPDNHGKNDTTSTTHTWCGLRPGSTYNFNVNVFAGKKHSANETRQGKTDPNVRNVTLSILCSSGTSGNCDETSSLLKQLRTKLVEELEGVYLDLKK